MGLLTLFIILKNRVESIREMLDTKGVCALVFKDQDDVKARFMLDKKRALINVYQRCLSDVISLATSYRLQGSIYRVESTCLHFNEDEMRVVVDDYVNFPIFGAEILAKQSVSLANKVLSGEFFTQTGELI